MGNYETQSVTTAMGKVSAEVAFTEDHTVDIKVSEVLDVLAEYIYAGIYDSLAGARLMETNDVSQHDVSVYIRYLFGLRLEQVSNRMGKADYRIIEIPVCVYPLLEAVGEYEGVESGIFLRPSVEKVSVISLPKKSDALVRAMKVANYPFVRGLPISRMVNDDYFYRLTVKDGRLYCSSGTTPVDPFILLARVFYEFQELNLIYGAYRYSIGDVRTFSSAFDALARLGKRE